MNKQEFNIKTAKYKNPLYDMVIRNDDTYLRDINGIETPWNPFEDANDLNKVIEKMGISVNARYGDNYEVIAWVACNSHSRIVESESRTKAQNACIWAVLEREE